MRRKNEKIYNSLLKIIKKNSLITEEELGQKFNLSERTIRRYLKDLKEKSLIELVGYGKNKKWLVSK